MEQQEKRDSGRTTQALDWPNRPTSQPVELSKIDEAIQASLESQSSSSSSLPTSLVEELASMESEGERPRGSELRPPTGSGRRDRRSSSLDELLSSSFVHQAPDGRRIVVSRGWPLRRKLSTSRLELTRRHRVVRRKQIHGSLLSARESSLNVHQKQHLLLDFLTRQTRELEGVKRGEERQAELRISLGNEKLIESALKLESSKPTEPDKSEPNDSPNLSRELRWQRSKSRPIIVHYELPDGTQVSAKGGQPFRLPLR